MSDKLLKDGLRTSEKIGRISEFAELLFVRLILATCYAGRCPWDPEWIRSHALPNRPRKRLTEIAAALETLRHAHLVTRYTGPDGTAYLLIPNHGQRLKHTVRSPWPEPPSGPPDVDGQTFMVLPGSPPLAAVKERKPKGSVCERATHFTSLPVLSSEGMQGEGDLRSASACLDELAPRYPRHDLRACLRACLRYVRKERGEDADVTVDFFVRYWMPKAPEKRAEEKRPVAHAIVPTGPTEAERLASLRALAESPEPARGTLDHALWLEARNALAETAA